MKNTKYQEFSAGKAGSGRINLATGQLEFVHTDTKSDSNILPVSISHVYTTNEAINANADVIYGNGFKLNLEQKLEKVLTGDSLVEKNDTRYIYTDSSGVKHEFEEKYYYKEKVTENVDDEETVSYKNVYHKVIEGENIELKPSDITIDLDGKLTHDGKNIYTELKTESGLVLQTELKNFNGSEKLETRHDELVKLDEEIEGLNKTIEDLKYMVDEYNKYNVEYLKETDVAFTLEDLINKQKLLEEYSLALEERSFILYGSDDIKLKKSSLLIASNYLNQQLQTTDPTNDFYSTVAERNVSISNYEYDKAMSDVQKQLTYIEDSIGGKNQEQLLIDKRDLQEFKTKYDESELTRIKAQYATQKLTADKLISKYKIMKDNKQHTYDKLGVQLPINYISQENIVFGFNKAGNLVSIFDKYDNQVAIIYDEDRIARVVDTSDKEILFEYETKVENTDRKLKSITDFLDRKTMFSYNSKNQLNKITYSDGEKTRFKYNEQGLLVRVLNSKFTGVNLGYDDTKVNKIENFSRIVSITTESGFKKLDRDAADEILGTLNITYNTNANTTLVADVKTGNVVEYTFNGEDCINEKVGNAGVVKSNMTITFEEVNGKTRRTTADKDGNVSIVEYKVKSQPLYKKSSSAIYKTENGITTKLNKIVETFFEYEDDKLIKERVVSIVNDIQGNFVVGSEDEFLKIYEYNKQGKPIRAIDSQGNVSETTYDKKGNVIKQVSYHKSNPAAKFYKEQEIAENGQVLAEIDERGENKTTPKYVDGTNILKGSVDSTGNEITFGLNPHTDEVLSISSGDENGECNKTVFTYEKEFLTKLTSGNTDYEYEYDDKGRKTAIKVNGKSYVSYEYSTDDLTTKAIYTVKQAEVDEQDIVITPGITVVLQTVTDKSGKVKSVSKNGHPYVAYEYDAKDRLVETIDYSTGNEKVIRVEHDDNGNVFKTTIAKDTNESIEIVNDVDANENIVKSKISVSELSLNQVYTYVHDEKNNTQTIFLAGKEIGKVEYDKLGRLESVKNPVETKSIHYYQKGDHATNLVTSIYHDSTKTSYRYDSLGNITEVYEDGELLARYSYDALNRIVREDNTKLGTFTYEYDTNGNILRKNQYGFTLALTTGGEKVRYQYEGDKLISFNKKSCVYDSLGNPTTYLDKKLEWEFRNLKSYDGTEFSYNASGMRTSKKQGEVETKFYYSGTQLLAEKRTITTCDLEINRDNPEYLYAGKDYYTTVSRVDIEYIYGADGVLGFTTNKAGEPTKTYYYRKNLQGDITHIFEEVGGKKLLKAKYVYDAWGNHTIVRDDAGIGTLNSFRYRGYYYDSETGLYWVHSRYYDPEVGRWISPDNIEILDVAKDHINGLNLYAYCFNNPIMMTDPTGCWPKWLKWVVTAVIVVVAVAAVVAVTVLTAGVGAAIVGGVAGSTFAATAAGGFIAGAITGAIAGALTGAVIGAGISVVSQGLTNGYDNINWGDVGKATWQGAVTGAISGAVFGGIGGAIKNYVKGGVDAAKASVTAAEQALKSTSYASQGGTIAAKQLATQLSHQAAQKVLWAAQWNASWTIAISSSVFAAAKVGSNYFLKKWWF